MSTPFLDEIFNRVDFERELVYKFFVVFSLFEYSLKKARLRNGEGNAEPDWVAFTDRIEDFFDPNSCSEELKAAEDYLMSHPPMKQVVEHGEIVFRPRRPDNEPSRIEELSIYIRRVRNNLFHGAKFRYDRERDNELIRNSLIVMESWAQLDQDVYRILQEVR